jgi:hypothetical protein
MSRLVLFVGNKTACDDLAPCMALSMFAIPLLDTTYEWDRFVRARDRLAEAVMRKKKLSLPSQWSHIDR